ncbi:MAG: helix-turn-helix domain-containing protein [Thermoplasmata archaeon]
MNYLRLISTPEVRRLLLASFVRARTAHELSEMTGIPIARCYRLLRKLRRAGLVVSEEAYVNRRGRVKFLFRSRLHGLQLFLNGPRLMGRIRQPRLSEPSEGR